MLDIAAPPILRHGWTMHALRSTTQLSTATPKDNGLAISRGLRVLHQHSESTSKLESHESRVKLHPGTCRWRRNPPVCLSNAFSYGSAFWSLSQDSKTVMKTARSTFGFLLAINMRRRIGH